MKIRTTLIAGTVACMALSGTALAQVAFTKVQVADRIRKVEDGVDEFRKWSEKRVEQGQTAKGADRPAARGRARRRPSRRRTRLARRRTNSTTRSRDLNQSTNRLRRKFDPTDKWLETRPQVENVMDDARKINQVLVRGKYGTQAERYWAVLRESINDLARCYNLTPLAS